MTQKYLSIHCIIRLPYTTVKSDTRSSRRDKTFPHCQTQTATRTTAQRTTPSRVPSTPERQHAKELPPQGLYRTEGQAARGRFAPGSPAASPRFAPLSTPSPARPGAAPTRPEPRCRGSCRAPGTARARLGTNTRGASPCLENNQLRFTYM